MKVIPLDGTRSVMVDDDDYAWLSCYRWYYLRRANDKPGYVARHTELNGRQTTLYMHRAILALPYGDRRLADHVNGDPLDNRRSNLRICDDRENSLNRAKQSGCSSHYKGVSWEKAYGKWEAYIHIDGRKKRLGRYEGEQEAALAYNHAALNAFGEYAKINQVEV